MTAKRDAPRACLLLAGMKERETEWLHAFSIQAPDMRIIHEDEIDAPENIDYCLIWRQRPGLLARLVRLKAVFSLGAGVDALLSDPSIPEWLPIIRMAEPGLTEGMVEYILWQTLFHHRRIWELIEAQRRKEWRPHNYPAPWDRRVGVMGLGVLGKAVALKLAAFGFSVSGWSRSAKEIPGVLCYNGRTELASFLETAEILICLLPLTVETRGILGARLFAQLPPGASLVNAARGAHLVEEDLLEALRVSHLSAATLDVFNEEPLPPTHPFWKHPRIFITPHNASITDPETAIAEICRQIARLEGGLAPEHTASRARDY